MLNTTFDFLHSNRQSRYLNFVFPNKLVSNVWCSWGVWGFMTRPYKRQAYFKNHSKASTLYPFFFVLFVFCLRANFIERRGSLTAARDYFEIKAESTSSQDKIRPVVFQWPEFSDQFPFFFVGGRTRDLLTGRVLKWGSNVRLGCI